jgi:uncharacterized membrane protein (DUF4010 family)
VTTELDLATAYDFGNALLLGALLGIEREKRNMREGFGVAGLRSFVMFAMLGAIGGFLAVHMQMPWVLVATIAAVAALVVAGYVTAAKARPHELGLTTELAAIVTCLLGALSTSGHRELAIALGVGIAALLAYKQPLHDLVGRLGWDDVLVGLRLLLALFLVLPLLEDRAIDPWGAINLYKLWLLVLLISGLSLVGYVATRWLGPGRGIAITALSGGLVSSTAVTLAMAKQSREAEAHPEPLAGGIALAWAVMFARVVVLAAVVAPASFVLLAPAFLAMAAVCGLASLWLLRGAAVPTTAGALLPVKNPFSLLAACKFAALFAGVQLLLKLGQQHLPQSGIHAVAALAGLTDVDAITVAMAERAKAVPADLGMAVVAIAVASASNTLVKAGMAVGMGRGLARSVLPVTAASLLVGGVVLWATA